MQVISVIRVDTYTNELRNTKDRQSETISESNMIWNQTTFHIAQSFRILRKCQNKFDCLVFEMFFFCQRPKTNAKQTVWFHPCKIICLDQFIKAYCCLLLYVFSLLIFTIILSLMSHILLLSNDHCIFKLFLTVTNIFMLITCTFLSRT